MKLDNLIGLKLFDRWIITSIDNYEHNLDLYEFNMIDTTTNKFSFDSTNIYNHNKRIIFVRALNADLTDRLVVFNYRFIISALSLYGHENVVVIDIETGKQIEINFNKQTIKWDDLCMKNILENN